MRSFKYQVAASLGVIVLVVAACGASTTSPSASTAANPSVAASVAPASAPAAASAPATTANLVLRYCWSG